MTPEAAQRLQDEGDHHAEPIVDWIGDISIHHGERDDDSGMCLCGHESYQFCPYWPEGGIAGVTWLAAVVR